MKLSSLMLTILLCFAGMAEAQKPKPKMAPAKPGVAAEKTAQAKFKAIWEPVNSVNYIRILVSPAGRFLVCRDCKLSFDFPDGARYGATAKRFEFHSCGSSERRFVIMRYEGKVPVMAACAKCEHKFFTPSTFAREPIGAQQYLANKFDLRIGAKSLVTAPFVPIRRESTPGLSNMIWMVPSATCSSRSRYPDRLR